jgi:hypothetical protein
MAPFQPSKERVVRRSGLIKAALAVVALGALGILFVRSAQNTRKEPYSVARERLSNWRLVVEPASTPTGMLLELRPPPEFGGPLFSQLFARSGQSLSGPVPAAMPLILQSEFNGSVAAASAPDALLALARAAGLEQATIAIRCMADRRVSEPGSTREVYFLRLDVPGFDAFRQQVGQKLRDAGGVASSFDPAALSPILIVAATDANFIRWLPLKPGSEDDCLAPVTAQ